MRRLPATALLLFAALAPIGAQDHTTHPQHADHEAIRQALLDYVNGFTDGDSTLLVRSVSSAVVKYGYWRNHPDSAFVGEPMTYQQMVRKPARAPQPRPNAPREAKVLDFDAQIASGKVKAWWGIDYILLAKEEGHWKIRNVIWQGPLQTVR